MSKGGVKGVSKYEKYKQEAIEYAHENNCGSTKVARYLKKKHPDIKITEDGLSSVIRHNKWILAADTFERDLDTAGFQKPDNWSHGWLKTKDASIFVKNSSHIVSFEQMKEDFVAEMTKHSPKHQKIKRAKIKDPHLLVVDLADLHIGKLSSETETGETYNVETAIKRSIEGVEGLLQKSNGFPIDKIVFVIGNDILHSDNGFGTTTSGTRMDTDRMWYDNFVSARKLYITLIEMLLDVADIHIVHNPSNHDYVTGFMLADCIYCWFKDHKNISFDISMAHRKYYQYGNNLIGTAHGDGGKMESLPLTMANEAKRMWADTYFRYIYLHHIHHKDVTKFKSGKEYQGVTVEYLRSPSGTDSWHHRNQFQHASKAIEAFIHSKEYGQVSRLTHIFKPEK